MASKVADIVIVGAGLVGRTLACALSKKTALKNTKIVLLENRKNSFDFTDIESFKSRPYHYRVSALNRNSYRLLNDLGVWKHIEKSRYGTIDQFYVWETKSSRSVRFENDTFSQDLAYVVENDLILAAVNVELEKSDNVEVIQGYKAKQFTVEHPHVKISADNVTETSDVITSKVLIGADGINSAVRKSFHFHTLEWNYDQTSIVCTLKLDTKHNNVAWQKFLTNGPLALLPLDDNSSSLVWSTKTKHAHELIKLPNETFLKALNDAFSNHGDFKVSSPLQNGLTTPPKVLDADRRYSFPLAFSHASNYIRDRRVILIGDAAHRIHPLAGQGLNLGYGDIVCLTNLLEQAVNNGSELDDYSYLKEYEKLRQRHVVPILIAIECLHRVYGTNCPIAVTARHFVSKFIDQLLPLKNFLIKQASL